jgi:hypothetical protein
MQVILEGGSIYPDWVIRIHVSIHEVDSPAYILLSPVAKLTSDIFVWLKCRIIFGIRWKLYVSDLFDIIIDGNLDSSNLYWLFYWT